MYLLDTISFEQPAGSCGWREQVLWIDEDAHQLQAFDDRPTRSSGGVGEIPDFQTGIRQLTHSFSRTRDDVAGFVEDAFQIEQQATDHAVPAGLRSPTQNIAHCGHSS